MRDGGYGSLKMEQLINARDHGVGADYVRDMRQLGYSVPLDELIRARDHGVGVEFVREMATLGYTKLPLDSLIRVRDHSITQSTFQELKTLGYDNLSIDDLVTLRDHGLSADRIRAANSRAGTRLPVNLLSWSRLEDCVRPVRAAHRFWIDLSEELPCPLLPLVVRERLK